MREEIHPAGAHTLRDSLEGVHAVRLFPRAVRPYIAVRVLVSCRLHGFTKPFVVHRSMPRHQVQKHMHLTLVGLLEKLHQILIRPIAGRNGEVVLHVVPRVVEGRQKTGVQPECIAAKLLDIIQFFDNALHIPDTVSVGIVEGLRINFIKDCCVKPVRSACHSRFLLSFLLLSYHTAVLRGASFFTIEYKFPKPYLPHR